MPQQISFRPTTQQADPWGVLLAATGETPTVLMREALSLLLERYAEQLDRVEAEYAAFTKAAQDAGLKEGT